MKNTENKTQYEKIDLSLYGISYFESVLNQSFRQNGSKYRSREHSSFVVSPNKHGILTLSTFNGSYGDKPLNLYQLLKVENGFNHKEICEWLKVPKTREVQPDDNPEPIAPKALILGDNTTVEDLQTLRHFQQKVGITSFEELNRLGIFPIKSYGRMFASRLKTPFLAYKETNFLGESLKLKDAKKTFWNDEKRGNVRQMSKQKEYCFGLNQIGETIKILITEGEDDAACINHNCQHIKAVTFGGVSSPFDLDVLEFFKSDRKPTICFDSDKAGFPAAPLMGEKYGIPFFNVQTEKGKDICDLYATIKARFTDLDERKAEFERVILAQFDAAQPIETAVQIVENQVVTPENEPIETAVNDELPTIVVGRYLDEKRSEVVARLKEFGRICLHGCPEIGKTTFVKNLAYDTDLMNFLGVNHVILVTPRVILAVETAKTTNSVIARGKDFDETDGSLEKESLVITNIDNINKLKNLLKMSVLVVDEFDKNTSDSPFRNVHNALFDLLEDAPFSIFMSGTPDMNVANYLNFKYLRCESLYRTENKRCEITYLPTTNYLNSYLSHIRNNRDKRHLVFHDSIDKIEIARVECEKMGLKVMVISRNAMDNQDSAYNQDGLKGIDNYNVVICTNLADAGIDIFAQIDFFIGNIKMNPRSFVQAVMRGRGDVNMKMNVLCFHPEKEKESFDAKEWSFISKIKKAQNICDGLNLMLNENDVQDISNSITNSIEKCTYFSEKHGKFRVNIPFCSYISEQRVTDAKTHFEVISKLDNSFFLAVAPVKCVIHGTIEGNTQRIAKETRISNRAAKDSVTAFIVNDLPNAIRHESAHGSNKTLAKDWIEKHGIEGEVVEIPANDTQVKTVRAISSDLMKRFFEVSKYIKVDGKDYNETYFANMTDSVYRMQIRRLHCQYRLKQRNDRLSPKDRQAKERSQKLASTLTAIAKNGKWLTKDELKQIVCDIYPIVTGSEWKKYVYCVTDVTEIEGLFQPVRQWSFKDACEPFLPPNIAITVFS